MTAEMSLKKLQKMELEVLQKFHSFCEEHSLTYYLIGGTLLGAIRHKGFIPWDDDIDVVMPRADYEKFIRLFLEKQQEQLPFKLATLANTQNYYQSFAKLFDARFPMIEPQIRIPCPLGPWVDIFPLDNMSDNYNTAVRFFRYMTLWRKMRGWKVALFNKLTLKDFVRRFLALCLAPFPRTWLISQLDKRAKRYAGASLSKYVCVVTMGTYGLKEIMPREWFEGRELHSFEDKQFYIPSGSHHILTNLYGDYMTPRKPVYIHFDITDKKENKVK